MFRLNMNYALPADTQVLADRVDEFFEGIEGQWEKEDPTTGVRTKMMLEVDVVQLNQLYNTMAALHRYCGRV